jgi:hypothetical protein
MVIGRCKLQSKIDKRGNHIRVASRELNAMIFKDKVR